MAKLEVTTNIHCPLMCRPCPQKGFLAAYGEAIREHRMLKLEDFATFLAKTPRHVTIVFSGMSEPFINPDCIAMIELALSSGFKVEVYSTLFRLSLADAEKLLALMRQYGPQVNRMVVHLPDARGNMPGWKPSPEYEAVLGLLRAANKDRAITKIAAITMDDSGEVDPRLAHLRLRLRRHGWKPNSRAGSLDDALIASETAQPTTPRHAMPIQCSRDPGYDNNILLPNGEVLLCCQDWSKKHVLGNYFDQSYYDLFAGPEMTAIRVDNLKAEFSERSLCRQCVHAVPLVPEPKVKRPNLLSRLTARFHRSRKGW